jgi:hypothetical protein
MLPPLLILFLLQSNFASTICNHASITYIFCIRRYQFLLPIIPTIVLEIDTTTTTMQCASRGFNTSIHDSYDSNCDNNCRIIVYEDDEHEA